MGMKRPCARARTWRERKEVQIAERQSTDELDGLLKFAIGLAGETDHHICAESEFGTGRADQSTDDFRIVPGTVAAMHAAEDRIGAGLKREMSVASETVAPEFGHECDHVAVPVHGLDRTEAEAPEIDFCEDPANQCGKCGATRVRRTEIAAPSAKVDPGKNEFVAACRDEALDLA